MVAYEESLGRVTFRVEGSPTSTPSMLTFRIVATIPDHATDIQISGAYRSSLADALESLARELGDRLKHQVEQNRAKDARINGLKADLEQAKARIREAVMANDFGGAQKREIAEQLTQVLEQLKEE